jgi:hypothetical protein
MAMQELFMHSEALLSDCGTYRYYLSRLWDKERTQACWIMLNPSTADAMQDDATIRRCCGFAESWGFGGIVVVNLFAFRATEPARIAAAVKQGIDPVGPENDKAILTGAVGTRLIAAWGNHGELFGRAQAVLTLLEGRNLYHLGLTASGQPKHPLYLPKDTKPVLWDYQALLAKSAPARL